MEVIPCGVKIQSELYSDIQQQFYTAAGAQRTSVNIIVGVGLMDEMVFETPCGDITYPGYRSVNNDDYNQHKYPGTIPLIYNLKSNATLDGQIHAAAYAMLNSGRVIFLAREQEVKNKLLATKKGQAMSFEKRTQRLMPHQMTTLLFNEMVKLN